MRLITPSLRLPFTPGRHQCVRRYTYRVSAIPDAEFKSEQPLPASGSIEEKRTVLNRHGIRIVVTQTGKIGKFEFQAMLLALVSSLGLLAVAKLVVDMVAVNCMPDRKLYAQYKVQQVRAQPDIADLQWTLATIVG